MLVCTLVYLSVALFTCLYPLIVVTVVLIVRCPNRAIARIGNWMPIVQSVPIGSQSGRWFQSGEKTSFSNVLHAAQMRHDVRRQIFCHTATMVWSINTQVIQIVAAVAYFYLVANELQGLFHFLSCSQRAARMTFELLILQPAATTKLPQTYESKKLRKTPKTKACRN